MNTATRPRPLAVSAGALSAMPTLQAARRAPSTSFRSLLARSTGRPVAMVPPAPRAGESTQRVGAGVPEEFANLINGAGERYGVDPTLIAAVTKAESGFNPKAVSPAGAKGLMQLMDGTARQLGVRNSFDPEQNVDGGARFLSEMLKQFKKPELALAAYNAGPGAVQKAGGVPPFQETQTYVKRVLALQRAYQGR